MDSLMAVELRNALSKVVGRRVPATLLFGSESVGALVQSLAESSSAPVAVPQFKLPFFALQALQQVGLQFDGDMYTDQSVPLLVSRLNEISAPIGRIFCLPAMGSTGRQFQDLASIGTPRGLEVLSLEYPRCPGPRVDNDLPPSLQHLVVDFLIGCSHLLDKPYALLGVSFGATVLHHLLHNLQSLGLPCPAVVFPVACCGPGSMESMDAFQKKMDGMDSPVINLNPEGQNQMMMSVYPHYVGLMAVSHNQLFE
eukprot:gene4883-5030_t